MKDTIDNSAQESDLAVSLTVRQLKALIHEEMEKNAWQTGNAKAPLLTAEQLAEHLNVEDSWVYEKSRQGQIPTIKVGRSSRFNLDEVLASQRKNGSC